MNKRPLPLLLLLLSSCSLAPDFVMPKTHQPTAYKEQKDEAALKAMAGKWKEAAPLEDADRGQWWRIFGDEQLNALEQQAARSNQTLKAASARVKEARAGARSVAPSFLPDLTLGANAVRAKGSDAALAAFGAPPGSTIKPYTLYSGQGVASYEVDLFGRVRDNSDAAEAEADAQEGLYRSTLLMLQADVAQHYFSLRALDTERALLKDTLKIREEANRIMQKRSNAGEAADSDLARTQSELASTQAELIALDRNRAILEHALAVLLGKMPSQFSFAEAPLNAEPPQIPPGIPSLLLQRRPDVAAAIATMQAANARIGVARSALLPSITLTASGGYESTSLSDLFHWSNHMWSLGQLAGSAVSWSIFESGRNLARIDMSKAAYKEAVANYRQQVLVAFRDVEDALSNQRLLAEQSVRQDEAAEAANRTTDLIQKRYNEGDVTYFEVVDAQRNSLAIERAAVQTRGQRFLTAIGLIRALGGGWGEPQPPVKPAP